MISDKVIDYFKELSAVPRPSGHCKAAADYIEKFAKRQDRKSVV